MNNREKAIEWWNSLTEGEQLEFSGRYTNDTGVSIMGKLTKVTEVEEIWKWYISDESPYMDEV